MKVATCGCKWCRAQMHKSGSKDMRHATRKGRMKAKAIIAKAVRNKDFDIVVPDRIAGGWMA